MVEARQELPKRGRDPGEIKRVGLRARRGGGRYGVLFAPGSLQEEACRVCGVSPVILLAEFKAPNSSPEPTGSPLVRTATYTKVRKK